MITKIWLEKYYPYVGAFIVLICCIIFKITRFDIMRFSDILNSFVNMSSIIIGFLATMISILIATVRKPVMRKIKANNATRLLTNYINTAVMSGILITVYSVTFNAFLDKTDGGFWYLFLIWVFIAVLFILSAYRILSIMLLILNKLAEYENSEGFGKNQITSSDNLEIKLDNKR